MKVYNLTNRKVEDYEDSYAARLIEQGKAILPEKSASKAAKAEEAPKETPKAGKAGGK